MLPAPLPRRFEPRSTTPFGRFVEQLLARHHRFGVPIEEILAYGLWVVMLSVGKKLSVNLVTETQIEEIAGRVNRLLEVGLLKRYEHDLHRASLAFDQEVLGLLDRALALGLRPGMDPSAAAWRTLRDGRPGPMRQELVGKNVPEKGTLASLVQTPSALFFAELIREAVALREEIEQLVARFYRLNVTDPVIRVEAKGLDVSEPLPYVSSEVVSVASWYVRYLGLEFAEDASASVAEQCIAAPGRIQRVIERVELLRRLPVRQEDIPTDEMDGGKAVDPAWINTQLYLAAGDVPEGDLFTSSNWRSVTQALHDLPADQIVDRFLARMLARGMRAESRQVERLRRRAAQAVEALKERHTARAIDLYERLEIFLEVRPEDVTLSPDAALAFVLEEGPSEETIRQHPALEDVVEGLRRNPRDRARYLREQVFAQILWADVKASDVRRMLVAEVLPVELITRGVMRMKTSEAKEACDYLILNGVVLLPDALEQYIERGLVDLDQKLAVTHGHLISPARLTAGLRAWLTVERRNSTHELSARAIATCLLRSPEDEARAILADPAYRLPLVSNLAGSLLDAPQRCLDGLSEGEVERLRDLAHEHWYPLLLAFEVSARGSFFEEATTNEVSWDVYQPPWIKMGHSPFGSWDADVFGVPYGPQSRALLERYSEEDVFRWLYADTRDLEHRLETYRAHRDAYYARYPFEAMCAQAESATPPTKP